MGVILVISVAGAVTPGAATENSDRDIVLVRDVGENEDVSIFEEIGDVLDRYGSYLLLEAPENEIESLETNYKIDRLEHRNNLNVKGHEFDTNQGYPDFESDLMIDGYEEGEEGIYIVDMVAPSNPEWREELENMGIEILNYQRNYAYEVVMTPEQVEQVEEKFFVDWVGIYQPGFKLAEDLKPGEVNIRLIEEPTERTIRELERKSDVQSVTELTTQGFNVNAVVEEESMFMELARMKEVYYISPSRDIVLEDEMQTQIAGGGTWFWDPVDDPDSPWRGEGIDEKRLESPYGENAGSLANQIGHTGDGVTVAVADTGLGNGNEGDAGHDDFTGRVKSGSYYDGDEWKDYGWDDDGSHGTRVAGIVGADTYHGTGNKVYDDYYSSQGMAPEVKIHAQRVFDENNEFTVENIGKIPEEAKEKANAYIHVNSWGANVGGEYDDDAEAYDEAVRDATGDNEPMIITAAAGNLGYHEGEINYNSIASPGSAKNIITVGATENYHPGEFDDDPNPNQVGIWPYPNDPKYDRGSARGWTDDNRVKPDLVAPGENVTSTSSAGNYHTGTGTSYANPAVAGAAANVVEYYKNEFNEKPSPALVKALLINTAEPLEEDQDGDGEKEYIPNKHEGWGSVNLANLFDSSVPFIVADHGEGVSSDDSEGLFSVTDNAGSLNSGESHGYEIVPSDPNKPLKVTLTWTDEPGNVGDDPALKNNLDLFVYEGEHNDWDLQFAGNAFNSSGDGESDDGFTKPGIGAMEDFVIDDDWYFDQVNNVQNVYIDPDMVDDETYWIGIDGTDVDGSQDYSLVMQNAEIPDGEEYELTIDSTEGGHTDPEEGTYTYTSGTTVDLSAYPHYGYEFDTWYVGGNEYFNKHITVTMDEDKDAYATFVPEGGPSPTSLNSDYGQYLREGPMTKELIEAFREENLSLPDDGKEAILLERADGVWNILVDEKEKYLIVEREKELEIFSYGT